ncbi:ABC transporter ATP-binding protein [Labrys wisconsinensis]|uniref:ABC-2 type transport system ATP-binding protein n=1 Tax=Labrys wisconsinensis TaxID=425677 RepID=A0ABU0IYJ4_9HYPH|nr:ABC transporter ATP-binding protein [Labrys wisconsinensis]MDQ0467075.1 ABC-2 type transport system ATP-binding protein [Labrys wisconsinensis]
MRIEAPALEIEAVSHAFGRRVALDDVSLTVPAGCFTALLGPNGAGKTTLFSIATRLYNNRSGAVRIYGHDIRRTPSRALAELGAVFQSRTLDGDLSVRENLAYHAALHGLSGRAVRARIEALLERVGLGERIGDKVRTLSGGQARRIEIARALVHRPRLLLLDEPTVGLDLASRTALIAFVRELVRSEGVAVLWASHIFDEVEPEDAVTVLHQGRVVASGTAALIGAGDASLQAAFRRLTAAPAKEEA